MQIICCIRKLQYGAFVWREAFQDRADAVDDISYLRQNGVLATAYVSAFQNKWVSGQRPTDEPLLGSPDIQSQADLANTSSVVQNLRTAPFPKDVVLLLTAATLAPEAPLLLTIMPLETLIEMLISILF